MPVRWICETNVGFESQGRQLLPGFFCPATENGKVADSAGRRGEKVEQGEAVRLDGGRLAQSAKSLRADQVTLGGCLQNAFETIASLALLDEFEETDLFEIADVAAHLLAGQIQTPGDAGRGIWLGQLR
ncbi:MAG TPA: hypothetical protein VKG25_00110 [Bryobacteraceae bacterium]|nr:hypothetical protein [Bryobacteraceae bacterium]